MRIGVSGGGPGARSGVAGSLPLGTVLLIAAVGGAAMVTIVGVVRLIRLRIGARRARRSAAKPDRTP